jgi:CBS domain-containing protein
MKMQAMRVELNKPARRVGQSRHILLSQDFYGALDLHLGSFSSWRKSMAKLARDIMTPNPACCTPNTTLDQVAKLMVQHDCGEIPVIDTSEQPIGVVTDRDIVCRVVAEGKNPMGHTAASCMTQPVVTVRVDSPLDTVVSTMEKHQIRRLPVVDGEGRCAGMIAQADVARGGPEHEVAELVREVSKAPGMSVL